MKTNTLFQVRFKPSVKPPRGFTKSAHYNVLSYDWHNHKYLIGNTWLHASNFIKIKVEDAPVFNKPVLRKIASLKPDEVIECNTDAELKSVLEQAEREALVWFNKKKPTEHIPTDPTPLYVYTTNDKRLAYFAKKLSSFTPLPASKFVEVVEQPESEWITDPSLVNFKENVGREFEMVMHNGSISKGRVVAGKHWQAVDITNSGNIVQWYIDANYDGTLKSEKFGGVFKFRWTTPPESKSEQPKEQVNVGEWVEGESVFHDEIRKGKVLNPKYNGGVLIEAVDGQQFIIALSTLRKIDRPIESYKPFPDWYVIPKGTRVVALTDGGYTEMTCREGDVGTVVSERSTGGGYVDFDGRAKGGWAMRYKELAPLDPRDHPEHPEFGKGKQEEPITQAQKDECRKIDDEIFQNPFSNQGELLERNNQLTGQIEIMKRLAKIALSNEDYEHMRVILRAIANGEI